MNVHHHLDNATLLRYASGDLDEAFAVVTASHLEMCKTCRRAAQVGEEVGGGLLETGDEAELSLGGYDRLMQKLDDDSEPIKVEASAPRRRGDVPAALQHFIGASLGEPCICLVATEAPTRFKGFFSRLLQPFVRI